MTMILAFDQGTTSSRAILFDRSGSIRGVAQREFTQSYPQAGWVEHDAEEIWSTQLEVARQVLQQAALSAGDIAAIGITNQRETTVLWDRKSGKPIAPAIVWQDRRTAAMCDQLRRDGFADMIQQKTGLVIDAYFSATKIRWLLDHVPNARSRAERGELACGTIDSWLVWNLTHGKVHVTDPSNASRTMLFNICTGEWDNELLALFQVPRSILPDISPSSMIVGEASSDWLGGTLPIAGIAGDQQAALFGQNCRRDGMVKNTYGTGCFMLMHVGHEVRPSKNQLLSTVAWQADSKSGYEYALEGSVFIAGAAVQWLRDGLGIISSSSEIESLARTVTDSGGVTFVPALSGLGAPHWDAYARGTIQGITRGTNRGHIARAALEGIAFQVADVVDAMQQDSGIRIEELRCDGGASVNNLLMQFQADVIQAPVVRPKVVETTALGAAFLAGLAVGFWKDSHEIEGIWQTDRVFEPTLSRDQAQAIRRQWTEAVKRSKGWAT
jgi:glycerol kinase